MTEISVSSQKAVGALVQNAPDAVLRQLAAVMRGARDPRTETVRRAVLAELASREARNLVFGPLEPMFRPRADGVRSRVFPAQAAAGLWRTLKSRQPRLSAQAAAMAACEASIDPRILDQLCISAAHALRENPDAVWVGLGPEQAAEIADHLDLTPLTRAALHRLRGWIGRPDHEDDAGLRLLIRDAGRITDDAAPRLMEILFANIADAPQVLTLAARITGSHDEGFLAVSELADFGERLFEAVEADADALDRLNLSQCAPEESRDVGARLCRATDRLARMELFLGLSPDGVWSGRFLALKLKMSEALVVRMKRCPSLIEQALPNERIRMGGAMMRTRPQLDAETNGAAVRQAQAAMALLGAARMAAPVLGCEGPRVQICEAITTRLSHYGDEAIEAFNAGEACDETQVAALIELCADFLLDADAEVIARALRRRLAASRTSSAPRRSA